MEKLKDIASYCLRCAREYQANKLDAIKEYGEDSSLAALYDGEREAFLQVVGYMMQCHHVSIPPESFAGTADDPI